MLYKKKLFETKKSKPDKKCKAKQFCFKKFVFAFVCQFDIVNAKVARTASQHVTGMQTLSDNASTGVEMPADMVPIASSRVKIRGGERLTFSSEPVFLTLVSFFSRTGLTCTAITAASHQMLIHVVAACDLFAQGVCACSHSSVTEASGTKV